MTCTLCSATISGEGPTARDAESAARVWLAAHEYDVHGLGNTRRR